MYRSRPAIPPDLRRTVDEQRRTINELRQHVADLSGRIAAADSADGDERRSLATELRQLQQQLITYADDLKALYKTVQQRGRRLRVGELDVIRVLGNAIEARDAGSAKHARHVAAVAEAVGRRLGLDAAALHALRLGALLHDLGNVVLDRELIVATGPLSREQWAKVREHPAVGTALIADVSALEAAVPVVRHHHERWDGRGYPDGLRAEAVPLAARALA
ncbi:MAG: HD domain-containing protein, partial [Chloroflexi bacterium]|nr:HD domain-containing protein [Chloroflexota bacterium]